VIGMKKNDKRVLN